MEMERFRGRTLLFHFRDGDGAMAHRTFEHTFTDDGGVHFKEAGPGGGQRAEPTGEGTQAKVCLIEKVREDVYAVSSLSPAGDTLTLVLDFATNRFTAFASNERDLSAHHGTFETRVAIASAPTDDVEGASGDESRYGPI